MSDWVGEHRWTVAGGLAALIGLAVAVVLLTGSSETETGTDPAPLTAEQAERLAVARFNNYRAETGEFEATVPLPEGPAVELSGTVDWRRHVASAVLRTPGSSDPAGNALFEWSFSTVRYLPGVSERPPTPPRRGWTQRQVSPTASPIDTVLLLILDLADDRPDNPQLLRQNGAMLLGEETVDGVPVEVVSGPTAGDGSAGAGAEGESRLEYWVDDRGELVRVEARIGELPDPAAIDFDRTGDPDVAVTPQLPVPRS